MALVELTTSLRVAADCMSPAIFHAEAMAEDEPDLLASIAEGTAMRSIAELLRLSGALAALGIVPGASMSVLADQQPLPRGRYAIDW